MSERGGERVQAALLHSTKCDACASNSDQNLCRFGGQLGDRRRYKRNQVCHGEQGAPLFPPFPPPPPSPPEPGLERPPVRAPPYCPIPTYFSNKSPPPCHPHTHLLLFFVSPLRGPYLSPVRAQMGTVQRGTVQDLVFRFSTVRPLTEYSFVRTKGYSDNVWFDNSPILGNCQTINCPGGG